MPTSRKDRYHFRVCSRHCVRDPFFNYLPSNSSNKPIRAVAASIVRMKYFLDVIKDGFNPHDDEDLAITRNLYWCMVESGLGLLAVCLPTLRSLWGTKASGWLTSVRSVFTLRSNISEPSKTSYAGSNKYANIADRGLSGWQVEPGGVYPRRSGFKRK